jgi:hypothetical protein
VSVDGPEDLPLHRQIEYLEQAIAQNPAAEAVMAMAGKMNLPGWYLGAGAVAQTVWNLRHGYAPTEGIKDYDLAYFDPDDLTAESERRIEEQVAARLSEVGAVADVHNQARVHLWYEERFGRHLDPHRSSEEAISTWPTTASSVGVRRDGSGFVVYAPFGLSDLVAMVARPNKGKVSQEIYEEKVARWQANWPALRVVGWD